MREELLRSWFYEVKGCKEVDSRFIWGILEHILDAHGCSWLIF